jgi:hypothetical protein
MKETTSETVEDCSTCTNNLSYIFEINPDCFNCCQCGEAYRSLNLPNLYKIKEK